MAGTPQLRWYTDTRDIPGQLPTSENENRLGWSTEIFRRRHRTGPTTAYMNLAALQFPHESLLAFPAPSLNVVKVSDSALLLS